MHTKKLDILVIACFALVWIVSIVFVNPIGNFPLNDDWAYAKPVQSFLETGRFAFTSWPAMTLIGQIMLGLFATKIFGFSFTVLRCMTLLTGVISIACSYLIFKKFTRSTLFAVIFSAGILFNPLFFSLSFTFMTDIPFFCFCLLGIYFNLDYYDSKNRGSFFAGSLFLIIAVLIRQPAVVVPISFCIASLFEKPRSRDRIVSFLIQFILVVATLLLYDRYLKYVIGYPRHFTNGDMNFFKLFINEPTIHLQRYAFLMLKLPIYLGLFSLFLLPVILQVLGHFSKLPRTVGLAITVGFCYGIFTLVISKLIGRQFPFANIINEFGLGPVLIDPKGLFSPPIYLWHILVLITIVYFSILVTASVQVVVSLVKTKNVFIPIRYLFPVFGILLYLPLVSFGVFFDRYLLLPLFLFFLFLAALFRDYGLIGKYSHRSSIVYILILLPGILYSTMGTRDYLTWNRARWVGLDYLTHDLKIAPEHIDGGIEFNGWYKYLNPSNPFEKGTGDRWYCDYKYLIAFVPVDGYVVIKTIPYQRLIPPRREQIVVLRKKHELINPL